MVDENKGVNSVVVEPPAATEPEKPEVEDANTPEVVPPAPETPAEPEVTPEPEVDPNPMVPRGRLNDEIKKRHELEARLKALEDARTQPPAPPRDEVEALAEQMSEEAGKDEYGNALLPVKAAKVVVMNQLRVTHASTANARLDSNVAEFVKANPRAAKYADRIKDGLSKLGLGVKDNPENVGRKYLELLGSDVENIEREAEERGKKKALEQKKIVGQAAGEQPGALPNGKLASDMLTADEKKYADKHRISYDDYYAAKGNKRV